MQQHELHNYLNTLIGTISTENPLEYFNSMYKSINPMAIDIALDSAEKVLENQNTKHGSKTA